jgi:S-DNA-T family DNA segregation ATPase FtsK/SpoIIIE
MHYIVIIVDEMADLMATHGKEVEGAIVRLAQMGRAGGIHLIVSTQRPSVETITGLIKANIVTRIAFQVGSQIDSRTIIDMAGAEKLLGRGDMLYTSAASPKPVRLQGILVTEAEVKKVVQFIKKQKPKEEKIGEDITVSSVGEKQDIFTSGPVDFKDVDAGGDEDDVYESAKNEVIRAGKASATLLQRRLRIGYARAARILDMLEEKGVVGPADGAKPRDVYITTGDPNYVDPTTDQEKRDKWQM